MKTPCKDCTDRQIGCHSKCRLYLDFKEKSEKASLERQKDSAVRGALINGMITRFKGNDKGVFNTHLRRGG